MADFRITVDLAHLVPANAPVNADVFPALSFAVSRVAEATQGQWVAYASGLPLPNGQVIKSRTGEYQRSILLRINGAFSAEAYSDLPYARAIEEGMPQRDLKRMLSSSLKVRVSAKGDRYLIIPFRWNSPSSVQGQNMPKDVWNWWKGKDASSILQGVNYKRRSGTGAYDIKTKLPIMVPAWRYKWGSRLGKHDLEDMGHAPNDRMTKRLEGMVNFRQPKTSGGGSHSQYLTFRVMSDRSKGWVVPAQPGKHPARATAQQMQPVAEEAFVAAVEADIARLLHGGIGG